MGSRRCAAVAVIGLFAAACSPGPASSPPSPAHTLTVFAAASLTAAFQSAGAAFGTANPGVRAEFQFAGSSTLATQIEQGAAADVFASADQPNMQRLLDKGLVDGVPQMFATNRLEIVVGAGNPKGIRGLRDLSRPGLVVVLCGPVVPCGRYAIQALQKAGVSVTPASQEADVKAVLSKVGLGEADAGIVYVTDVSTGGARVQGVEIPPAENVIAGYPIAVVSGSRDQVSAQAFVGFILSPAGQRILANFGFGGP